MELSEHVVEQLPHGLGMSVSSLAPTPVVRVSSGRVAESREGPKISRVVELVVLHKPAPDVLLCPKLG